LRILSTAGSFLSERKEEVEEEAEEEEEEEGRDT
jgi:hypothetical protein